MATDIIDFDNFVFTTPSNGTGWDYDPNYLSAIQRFTITNDVTVTGTVTSVTSTLFFNITTGKTLTWKASLEGDASVLVVLFSSLGTLKIISGKIENKGNGVAISAGGNPITVTGGKVIATNGNAIEVSGSGSTTTVSGGEVIATNGNAISASGTVTVSGGKVIATNGNAISTSGFGSTVTVSGGVVLGKGAGIADAIYASGGLTVSNDGVVIAWDKPSGTPTYTAGTKTNLTSSPADKAVWALDNLQSGIRYTNGSNSGFIALADVEVGIPPRITTTKKSVSNCKERTFQVKASGHPAPTFSISGEPAGVSIDAAGLITIAKTVSPGTPHTFTITATNGIDPDATQDFTLTVRECATSFKGNIIVRGGASLIIGKP